jgi:hypothetical protein
MTTVKPSSAGAISRGEFEPAGALVDGDQIVQPRLVDRHLATFERGDLGPVLVDTGHLVAEVG